MWSWGDTPRVLGYPWSAWVPPAPGIGVAARALDGESCVLGLSTEPFGFLGCVCVCARTVLCSLAEDPPPLSCKPDDWKPLIVPCQIDFEINEFAGTFSSFLCMVRAHISNGGEKP